MRAERLESEVVRLQERQRIAVDALKEIGTHHTFGATVTGLIADRALRELGFTPMVVRPDCPPDTIYFLNPSDWGLPRMPPTDYL